MHSRGFALRDLRTTSGRDVVATYRGKGTTVRAAGPVGSTVTAVATDHSVTASLTTPDPKTQPPATAEMASGQTLVDNALAVGFSPRAALREAAKLHVRLGSDVTIAGIPVREAEARWGSNQRSEHPSAGVVAAAAPIIASPCVSNSGDGGNATSRYCDVQRKVQADGADWYLGDAASGSASDDHNRLTQFRGNTQYGSGNSIVQWKPTSALSPGSCSQRTFSITAFGTGFSSTSRACPNKINIYQGTAHFGLNWTGCSHGAVGIGPVDLDHSPPSSSAAITVDAKLAWDQFFPSCG